MNASVTLIWGRQQKGDDEEAEPALNTEEMWNDANKYIYTLYYLQKKSVLFNSIVKKCN